MRGVLVLCALLSVVAAAHVDEDDDLSTIKDSIIHDAAASERAELKSLEHQWLYGTKPSTAAPAASASTKHHPWDDSSYVPLACPKGFQHNSNGDCVKASPATQEPLTTECGTNMVFANGKCHCRRGFHFVGGKQCEANQPMARLCHTGWFYYRKRCVQSCPSPFVGDSISRHCIIPGRPETQAVRCGKHMTLSNGKCVCNSGFRRARGGNFCIRYRKVFHSCRKGYFKAGKTCVKTCPAPLLPEKHSRKCMTQADLDALAGKLKSAKNLAAEADALAQKRARALLRAKEAADKKKDKRDNRAAIAAAAALRRARARVAALEKQIASIKAQHWTKNKQLAAAVGRAKSLASSITSWKLKLLKARRDSKRVARLIKHLTAVHKRLTALEHAKSRALAKAKARAAALERALNTDRTKALSKARSLADLKAKALLDAMRRARAAARAKARALARRRALDLARAQARAAALARAQALAKKRADELARQHAAALRRAAELDAQRRRALALARAQAASLRKRQISALRHCRDKAAQRKEALAAARALAAAQLKAKEAKLRSLARARDLARAKAEAAARALDAVNARKAYLRQLRRGKKGCTPHGCPKLGGSSIAAAPAAPKKVAPKTHRILVKCRRGFRRHGLFCVPVTKKAQKEEAAEDDE